MADKAAYPNQHFSRTFSVTMTVLGVAAALQILAVAWAVYRRPLTPPPGPLATTSAGALPTMGTAAGISPAPGGGIMPAPPASVPQAGDLSLVPTVPNRPVLPPPPDGATGAVGGTTPPRPHADEIARNPAHQIADPAVLELVLTGVELRASGNMQGALTALRQAEAAMPNHPRILAELAYAYTQMGLDARASEKWARIRAMGPGVAGAYYDLATVSLATPAPPPEIKPAKEMLAVSRAVAIRDREVKEGEKVTLRVSVRANRDENPDGSQMALNVYFYDQVNGEHFEQTTADTSQIFVSAPYDWADGLDEVIEVTYYQPVFTPEQKRELGERKYFGYVIELYYRDELQDVVAEPAELANGSAGKALPEPEPRPAGADNALFPE